MLTLNAFAREQTNKPSWEVGHLKLGVLPEVHQHFLQLFITCINEQQASEKRERERANA